MRRTGLLQGSHDAKKDCVTKGSCHFVPTRKVQYKRPEDVGKSRNEKEVEKEVKVGMGWVSETKVCETNCTANSYREATLQKRIA